jgi:hypothetical protein
MQRPLLAFLTGLLVAWAPATSASAATEPLRLPPGSAQRQVTLLANVGARDLAYVPTVTPRHYAFAAAGAAPCSSSMLLHDMRHRASTSDRQKHMVEFSVVCFPGSRALCADGAIRTFRRSGLVVYWDGVSAWRCQQTPNGRLVKISASKTFNGRPTLPHLPAEDLAAVVASAKRVGS